MTLQIVLDIGNSNIVIGVFQKTSSPHSKITPLENNANVITNFPSDSPVPYKKQPTNIFPLSSFRLVTPLKTTTDELALKIRKLLDYHKVKSKNIKEAIFFSVVPSVNHNITKLINLYFGIDAIEINHRHFEDFCVDYDSKEDLGIDRLVNLKAAQHITGLPAVVVDFGTAITVDVINENQHYQGGLIMPGMAISLEAMVQRTSKLPNIELGLPKKLLGNSTKESMQNGIYFMIALSLDTVLDNISKSVFHEKPFHILSTGGFARFISHNSKWKQHIIPSLTLSGGKIILDEINKNIPKQKNTTR